MRFTSLRRRRRTPSVIIVSLIDVLLVVMIFMMVSTTLKKENPALKLSLPESKQAQAGASDIKPFVISIATNAPFFHLEKGPVSYERLQKELVSLVQQDPKARVAIKADKLAPFGEVIRVIDAAKAANVTAISAITEKPAPR